ncbi:winged helix-turn-helix domain-containing protein [Bacillus cereus]|uniref:winged helix-turn-helix domain-containing protein n=1 Tax=Bacillus cereus TaxID=1396 RepID=UPI0018F3806E|nr:winged helix-turn-helix domain-containing protein [Bacillus cereus]MBJ7984775.1 winged helix-turn-helix transcriptional regulator [Bacillus cereus]MCU5719404.1 winged helix-turn-helix domain-containing protein [Bacillus cereus]
MSDKTWSNYLAWRNEQGLTGLSTEEEYDEFMNSYTEEEAEKLTKQELNELEIIFKDVLATPKEQATFDAMKDKLTGGFEATYNELAELAGVSEKTVRNHIKALSHKGYLTVTRTQKANRYNWGVDMKTKEQVVIYPVAFTAWEEFFEEVRERLGLIEIDTRSIAIHTKYDYVEADEQLRLQVNKSIKNFWFTGNELNEIAYKQFDPVNYDLMLTIYSNFGEVTHKAIEIGGY